MTFRKPALAALVFSMACLPSLATPPGELATHLFPHKDGEARMNTGGNANDWIEVGRNGTVGWITYQTGGVDLSHTTGSALTLYVDKVYTGGTIKVFALTQPVGLGEMVVEGNHLFYNGASPLATAAVAAADEEKILRLDLGNLLQQGPFHGLVVEASGSARVDFGAKESPVQPLIELRYAFATAAQVQAAIDAGLAAQQAADAAVSARDAAEDFAAAADASSIGAQGYATLAGQHAAAAAGSASAAAASATQAAVHETGASAAAGDAASSATAASESATASAVSALASQAAAGAAAGHASAAGLSASEASSSAGSATGSAAAAAGSATAAAGHEAGALAASGQAAGFATAAGAEAGAASGYAATAGSHATQAGISAGDAAGHAAAAETSAGSCLTSANAAAGSATSAAGSAEAAAASAAAAQTGSGLPAGGSYFSTSAIAPAGYVNTGVRINSGEFPWTFTTGTGTGGRYGMGHAVYNGRLHITGGDGGFGTGYNLHQAFDPATASWSTLAPLPTTMATFTLTELGGMLYAIGGRDILGVGTSVRSATYRYNPATNSWSTMASIPTGRHGHMAVAFGGRIHVFGGNALVSGTSILATHHIYDPSTNSWSLGTPLPEPRGYGTVNEVNGKFYLIGGVLSNGSYTDAVTIYNPATDSYSTGSPMPRGVREVHSSVVADGLIYVMGGYRTAHLADGEQYDPVGNTWSPIAPMNQIRAYSAAGYLNGRIYMVGGQTSSAFLNSVEQYIAPRTLFAIQKQ